MQELGPNDWLGGTHGLSQAGVTTVVSYSFANTVLPGAELARQCDHLDHYVGRCEALDAFARVPVPPTR